MEASSPPLDGQPPEPDAALDGWRGPDGQGRYYVPARGRPGQVFRQGNETVAEAQARAAKGPKDKRPKPKAARPKPPAPTKVDLKQLEWELAEALRAPAMMAGLAGDRWAADHFTREAPVLARNLVAAAEHNPWLRAKLEAIVIDGDTLLFKLLSVASVAGATVAYAVPPMIYYGLLPFMGPQARELFGVPDRGEQHRAQAARYRAEQEAEDAAAAQAEAAQGAGEPEPVAA